MSTLLHIKITGKGLDEQINELFYGSKATRQTKGLEKHARKRRTGQHPSGTHPYRGWGYQKKRRKTGRIRYC